MSEFAAQAPFQAVVTIRKGDIGDANAIWRMFQAHLNWINVWYEVDSVVQRRDSGSLAIQEQLLAGYPSAVAEIDGQVVGYCVTEFREIGVLEVRNVYVDDPYRDKGIGASLLREVESQCNNGEVSCLVAFASSKYYRDKRCPTGLFERTGFTKQALFPETEMYLKTLVKARNSFSTFATSPVAEEVIRLIPNPE